MNAVDIIESADSTLSNAANADEDVASRNRRFDITVCYDIQMPGSRTAKLAGPSGAAGRRSRSFAIPAGVGVASDLAGRRAIC